MNLGSYCDTWIKDLNIISDSKGQIAGALAAGIDVVKIIGGEWHDCPICKQYEGNKYSLTGKTKKYPKLSIFPPFHPNCSHVIKVIVEEEDLEQGEIEATIRDNIGAVDNLDEAYNKGYQILERRKKEVKNHLEKSDRLLEQAGSININEKVNVSIHEVKPNHQLSNYNYPDKNQIKTVVNDFSEVLNVIEDDNINNLMIKPIQSPALEVLFYNRETKIDDVLEYRGFLSRNKHNPSALDIHITPFDKGKNIDWNTRLQEVISHEIGHILSKNDYILDRMYNNLLSTVKDFNKYPEALKKEMIANYLGDRIKNKDTNFYRRLYVAV